MNVFYSKLSLFFFFICFIHYGLYTAPKNNHIQVISTSFQSNYRMGEHVTSITSDEIVNNEYAKNVYGVIGSTYYLGNSSIKNSILVLDAGAAALLEDGAALLVADGYGGHTDDFEDEQIFSIAQASVDYGLQGLIELPKQISKEKKFKSILDNINDMYEIFKDFNKYATEQFLRSFVNDIKLSMQIKRNLMFYSADSMLVGGRAFKAKNGNYDFFAFNVGDSMIIALSQNQDKKWHNIQTLCPACKPDSEQQFPSLPSIKSHHPHEVIIKTSKNILSGNIILAISDGVYDALGGIESENSKFKQENYIIDYLNANEILPEVDLVIKALVQLATQRIYAPKEGDDFCIFGVKL